MKKIKLIKEYPGSPMLGSIVDVVSSENYPEYWEDVIEEYEILELLCKTHYKPYILHKNGLYGFKDGTGHAKLDAALIHFPIIKSIKRLSDGEIFTIGDNIVSTNIPEDKGFKITHFSLKSNFNNDIIFICGLNRSCVLKDGKTVKTPLFTTDDGVDIFEGDNYYLVDSLTIKFHGRLSYTATGDSSKSSDYFYFSTKEAAEEYIYENEPRFSFKDIVDAIEKSEDEILKPKWLFQRSVCDALEKYCLKENK